MWLWPWCSPTAFLFSSLPSFAHNFPPFLSLQAAAFSLSPAVTPCLLMSFFLSKLLHCFFFPLSVLLLSQLFLPVFPIQDATNVFDLSLPASPAPPTDSRLSPYLCCHFCRFHLIRHTGLAHGISASAYSRGPWKSIFSWSYAVPHGCLQLKPC